MAENFAVGDGQGGTWGKGKRTELGREECVGQLSGSVSGMVICVPWWLT